MTEHHLATILHHLRRTAADEGSIGDAELLERFVRSRDGVSFELLMWRHAKLVWSVCRRILQNDHDAEDAFQVTFLALARQAGKIKRSACLAGWLYQVAYRASLAARAHRVKRRELPLRAAENVEASVDGNGIDKQDRDALDQEIARLPERFQVPVVLCYLQGKTVSEAALLLGWPRGTVASRLARARVRLRKRLIKLGLDFSSDLPVSPKIPGEVSSLSVAIPVLAKQIVAGANGAGVVAPQVASLTKEVMQAMFLSKLKSQAIFVVTVVGLLLAGGGGAVYLYAVSPGKNPDDLKNLQVSLVDEPPTKQAADADKTKPPAPSKPKTVTVVQPVCNEVAPYSDYSGRLVALQQVEVQPTVSGRLEKVLFQPGTDVKKGDALFEIDPTTYQLAYQKATAEVIRVQAQIKQKEESLEYLKKIQIAGQAPEKEMAKAAAEVTEAKAALRQAQLEEEQVKTKLLATKITAPMDGRISESRVDPGNQVYAGADKTTVLATITVVDPIGLNFEMDERSYLHYKRLMREKEVKGLGSQLSMAVSGEEGFPRQGMLVSFADRIDPATGTIRTRAKFNNSDGLLLPGMFARVRMTFGSPKSVMEVPRYAVWGTEDHQGSFVLVVNYQNKVERRMVVLENLEVPQGPTPLGTPDWPLQGKTFIKEGLKPEDWVIIDNINELKPGDQVEVRRVKPESGSGKIKK